MKKQNQKSKFIDAARELGCKEDPRAFDRALKQLADSPPTEAVQKRKMQHASDCAIHNGPALPAGPCDCGAS